MAKSDDGGLDALDVFASDRSANETYRGSTSARASRRSTPSKEVSIIAISSDHASI